MRDTICTLSLGTKRRLVRPLLQIGAGFAFLDARTISKLKALNRTPTVRFEGLAESGVFSKRRPGVKQVFQWFPVSINIFGPKSVADDVAWRLSALPAYLQHPNALHTEVEYYKPQFLTLRDEDFFFKKMNDLQRTVVKFPP